MADTKTVSHPVERHQEPIAVERSRDFWGRYNRPITIAALAIILLGGGYLAYKNFVQEPKEQKAAEAIFKAEEYYRLDSFRLALNGDGMNPGFIKLADQYDGTKAGNLAKFYAGASFLQTGDAAKAVNYLDDFETDAKQIQARAYKLLGDAYAEQGKNGDALSAYKKAAHHFEKDEANSSDYLFMAAYFAARVANDQKQAVELFKELKQKYPRTERGFEADKYLAQLGEYK
jgi:predicted negative regulator of RcsB-dependent stress response